MPKRHRRPDRGALPGVIDRADRDLLNFAVSWLPYGGPPEGEMLVQFGLIKEMFPVRLRETVIRQHRHIHPRTAERLFDLCDQMTEKPRPLASLPRRMPVRGTVSPLRPHRPLAPAPLDGPIADAR